MGGTVVLTVKPNYKSKNIKNLSEVKEGRLGLLAPVTLAQIWVHASSHGLGVQTLRLRAEQMSFLGVTGRFKQP